MNTPTIEEIWKQRSNELDESIKEKIKEVGKNRRGFSSVTQKFDKYFRRGPLTEINEDWLTVRGFAMGVRDDIIRESLQRESLYSLKNNETPEKQKEWDDRIRIFVTVAAYLELARMERDPGEAWRYVNSADKNLPLIVDEKNLSRCVRRFSDWDAQLPEELRSKMKEKYDEISNMKLNARDREYSIQAARVRFWNTINSHTSLRYNLWRSLTYKLLPILIIAIFVAEYSNFMYNSNKLSLFFPYVTVSVMGFFGGGLSSILIARKSIVDIPGRVDIEIQITLRMLIGAAGALVMYIIVQSGVIVNDFSKMLNDNVAVLLILGIAAGFSEQLFVTPLQKISSKLNIIDKLPDGIE